MSLDVCHTKCLFYLDAKDIRSQDTRWQNLLPNVFGSVCEHSVKPLQMNRCAVGIWYTLPTTYSGYEATEWKSAITLVKVKWVKLHGVGKKYGGRKGHTHKHTLWRKERTQTYFLPFLITFFFPSAHLISKIVMKTQTKFCLILHLPELLQLQACVAVGTAVL